MEPLHGEKTMTQDSRPKWFEELRHRHVRFMEAVEALGTAVREAGPLDEKTGQLVQLASAATSRSEGAVHSHARRALAAGASPEEVRHTIMLLTSTMGFPAVSAALSWVEDILTERP